MLASSQLKPEHDIWSMNFDARHEAPPPDAREPRRRLNCSSSALPGHPGGDRLGRPFAGQRRGDRLADHRAELEAVAGEARESPRRPSGSTMKRSPSATL
jgi:hypothetical protein